MSFRFQLLFLISYIVGILVNLQNAAREEKERNKEQGPNRNSIVEYTRKGSRNRNSPGVEAANMELQGVGASGLRSRSIELTTETETSERAIRFCDDIQRRASAVIPKPTLGTPGIMKYLSLENPERRRRRITDLRHCRTIVRMVAFPQAGVENEWHNDRISNLDPQLESWKAGKLGRRKRKEVVGVELDS